MANHTFLYDDVCPMCKGYTGIFSGLNWSDRKAFSKVAIADYPELDVNRGRHEIPLLDKTTGEVRYGLDAMTTIMANGLPLFRPLFRSRYFIAALKPLYWLITYNRRVIAGTKPPVTGFDCAPDFHRGWRLAYLGVAMVLMLLIGCPPWPLIVGLGIALPAGLLLHRKRLEFSGHWVTVCLLVCLITAAIPTTLGTFMAFGVAAIEGWRRGM